MEYFLPYRIPYLFLFCLEVKAIHLDKINWQIFQNVNKVAEIIKT